MINGNGREVTFYIGIRSVDNAATASKILEKSFVGNFPGSTLRSMKNGEIAEVMATVAKTDNYNTSRNVSCVTVIPSMRDEDKDKFVQGIEKFIDTMQGEKFTAVFIAKPVPKDDLEMRKRGFEELYSSLSPFVKTSLAYGENYSKAVTSGMFENFSHSVNNSISNTTGKNSSTSSSRTHGTNSGSSIGGGGFSINSGTTNSTTSGYSSGSSWSKSVTEGFIIVDQSPTAVDIAAIKNTNTKILMRLPEKGDCEAVGNAAGLNEEQVREMSKLGTGIAVVMQNNWLEAVLTHIDAFSNQYEKKIPVAEYSSLKKLKGAVIQELMQQYIVDKTMNMDRMMAVIDSVDAVTYKKEEIRCCMRYVISRLQKGRDIDFFCETLLNVSGTKNLFDIIETTIKKSEVEDEKYDKSSVVKWKSRFRSELTKYVDLPDNFNNTILKYLIHAQELEQNGIDYFEVKRILY